MAIVRMVLVLIIKGRRVIKRILLSENPTPEKLEEYIKEEGAERAIITSEYIRLPFE